MDRKIPVYVLLLTLFIGSSITVSFGWAVRHVLIAKYDGNASSRLDAFGDALLTIAKFPSLLKETNREIIVGGRQVIEDRFPDLDGFKKSGRIQKGALDDKGYLLLSTYDNDLRQSIVQLIRLSDQQILYELVPDIETIEVLLNTEIIKSTFLIMHPFFLKDGGLVFHDSFNPLFKIDSSGSIEWYIDDIYHHSIEPDAEGNIWVCSYWDDSDFGSDAISKISPAGEVLYKKNVGIILEENGYRGLLAAGLQQDPIHLNDVQPALTDSKFWKKGDLFLSMRNRSTIALYRPSTDKIIWLKTGPWLNQHDVDIVNDHQISVFGNDVIDQSNWKFINGHNNVYIYDFITDAVTTPYNEMMKSMEVRTETQGLCKVLSNGDVFIEESDEGRILRLSPDMVKWEFVRRVDENHLARFNWSRYLTEEKVRSVFPKLQNSSYNQ